MCSLLFAAFLSKAFRQCVLHLIIGFPVVLHLQRQKSFHLTGMWCSSHWCLTASFRLAQRGALHCCTSLRVLSSQASSLSCKIHRVRRATSRKAVSRCREQYSVHALQRFGRMCEATGPARYGPDEPFDDWASRLPCSHSGHSAGISFATSSDVSSDLQQEA